MESCLQAGRWRGIARPHHGGIGIADDVAEKGLTGGIHHLEVARIKDDSGRVAMVEFDADQVMEDQGAVLCGQSRRYHWRANARTQGPAVLRPLGGARTTTARGSRDLSRICAAPLLVWATCPSTARWPLPPNSKCFRRGIWKPLMDWSEGMSAIGPKEGPNAVSACRRVFPVRRQISSALMALMKVRRSRKQSARLFSDPSDSARSALYPCKMHPTCLCPWFFSFAAQYVIKGPAPNRHRFGDRLICATGSSVRAPPGTAKSSHRSNWNASPG